MNLDGTNQRQITFDLGYDGGGFFSPDGTQIVFRASRPKTAGGNREYRDYLAQHLVAPTNMEIYTCAMPTARTCVKSHAWARPTGRRFSILPAKKSF
jgi:hypothetical protein